MGLLHHLGWQTQHNAPGARPSRSCLFALFYIRKGVSLPVGRGPISPIGNKIAAAHRTSSNFCSGGLGCSGVHPLKRPYHFAAPQDKESDASRLQCCGSGVHTCLQQLEPRYGCAACPSLVTHPPPPVPVRIVYLFSPPHNGRLAERGTPPPSGYSSLDDIVSSSATGYLDPCAHEKRLPVVGPILVCRQHSPCPDPSPCACARVCT